MEQENLSNEQPQKKTWLASFPEKNPNPILEISLEGCIEYTNPAIRKIFPTLLEQQTDHPYLTHWAEIADHFRNQADAVITREVSVGEEYFQQSIHFIEQYQRLRVYGMNITERKQLEMVISESERKYRELVQFAAVGIYQVDFQTQKFVTVNDAMCLITGYSRDELMAMNPMDLLDETGRQVFQNRIQMWLAGEKPDQNVEYRILAKGGREIFAELNVTFTTDEQGKPVGASVIGVDVTERKRAEQALQWTNQTLQQQAEELEAQAQVLQKQAEKLTSLNRKLQESEERFSLALKNMPIVVANLDRELRYTWIYNPLGGFKPEEVLGKRAGLMTDEEATQIVLKSLQEVITQGVPTHWEVTSDTKQGERHFIAYAEPLRDQAGEIIGAGLVSIDITERKHAEEQLAYHASLIDNLHDAIVATDIEQHITAWNQSAEKLYGYTAQEVMGKTPKILRSEISDEQIAQAVEQMAETGRFTVEVVQYAKNGQRLIVEGSTIPRRDSQGKITGYVSAGRDITGRKQAEALDKALNRVNQIIHSHLSFDQIMQQSLTEAAKALECDSAAISLRQDIRWIPSYVWGAPLDVLGKAMNDQEERHALLAIQTKQPVAVEDAFNDERFNLAHLRKWGIRSVLVIPILLRNEAIGALFFNYQRAVHHFQDMHLDFGKQLAASISLALENSRLIENLQAELSVRRKAEKELEVANAYLEQRVKERTAELELAALELQAANLQLESAEEELTVQNTELENALETEKSLRKQIIQAEKYAALARLLASVAHEINNPLQTINNSLYLLAQSIPPGELQDILEMAIYESRRIGALVQQLHETYQPHNQQPAEFNLIALLPRVFTLLGPQFKQNNVRWQFNKDQDSILVQGMADQIQQVFLNICLNAIDAMSSAGGMLTVRVTRPEPGRVCISFQDNGPGIPQLEQAHIFEPFFTTKEKGLGLGLPICYEIVKGHGGDIYVESEPGKGATFFVWLPAV